MLFAILASDEVTLNLSLQNRSSLDVAISPTIYVFYMFFQAQVKQTQQYIHFRSTTISNNYLKTQIIVQAVVAFFSVMYEVK
jgi:hypothetical protein